MLYIVSTPIGNLQDISERALKTLQEVDLILCEDTRHSSILLSRYEIKKPLMAWHKFNERSTLDKVLEVLSSGQKVALISDAGTPCINDPGRLLVDACMNQGIKVTAIPGPCSLIEALVLSGFETDRFQFVGFLPKKPASLIKSLLYYPGVTIAFESPQRIVDTLVLLGDRRVAVARELTKTFEECRRGPASELLAHFEKTPPKGEIVLLIDKGEVKADLSLQETVELLQQLHGLSLKEAIHETAHLQDVSKKDVYRLFI